jgi:hypothetical protein
LYQYKLYNLTLTSCIEFKFLKQTPFLTSPDVEIAEEGLLKRYNDTINRFDAYIFRKGIGFFHIQAGKKIIFKRQDSKVSDETLARSMINAVFGYLLYQRGYFVLHASALKFGISSFAFLGRSGSGKSSLTADLSMNHSADFICEDVACISDNIDGIAIKNAPPLIKLSDEISHKLNFNQKHKINLVADRLNRSFYRVQENTSTNKLIACFFLEWGDSFSMEKLEDSRVLPAFLLNTYSCYPFNSCIESSKDFHNFTHEFIKKIPIFKITRNKKDGFKNSIEITNFLNNLIK